MRQSEALIRMLTVAADHGFIVVGVDDGEAVHRNAPFTAAMVLDIARSVDEGSILLRSASGQRGSVGWLWQGPDETYEDGVEVIWNFSNSLDAVYDAAFE